MTGTPRFSIVIPSRNRPSTLAFALDSVLKQSFESFEVVVVDNASGPATEAVVASRASARLRYVRVDRPLAMTDNWDHAVGHARGDFVTVLGDDDALLPGALIVADRVLAASGLQVLRWSWALYYWPDSPPPLANRLSLPLSLQLNVVDGKWAIREVVRFRRSYDILPMLYNSFVSKELLSVLRGPSGRLLASMSPDIYSGFAVAHVAGEYASMGMPLGVAGQHGQSNGMAVLSNGSPGIRNEFDAFNAASESSRRHAMAPPVPAIAAAVADSFLWARDRVFPKERGLRLRSEELHARILSELGGRSDLAEEGSGWAAALAHWARTSETPNHAFTSVSVSQGIPRRETPIPRPGQVMWGQLHINASAMGVFDVVACARLCSDLYATEDPASVEWNNVARLPPSGRRETALRRFARGLTPPAIWNLLAMLSRKCRWRGHPSL